MGPTTLSMVPQKELLLIADVCDQNTNTLARVLGQLEAKNKALRDELELREDDTASANDRLVRTEQAVQQLKAEFNHLQELELLRRHEVCRLEAVVEAERLQFSLTEHRLQHLLADEQQRADRLRMLREDALSQREDAMAELASAYADLEAMQATLSDSAVYVRYLRRKVLELEVENSRHAARTTLRERAATDGGSAAGVFNMSSIKAAIVGAVNDAYEKCDEEERRKRLKQLQLRWHPDKHPVLNEVASEVTKLINEAVTAADNRKAAAAPSSAS